MSPIVNKIYKETKNMMNGSNYSLSDIAAATGSNNRANDMWGGDGFSLIWLVLIFAIFGWGGFGGWGGAI